MGNSIIMIVDAVFMTSLIIAMGSFVDWKLTLIGNHPFTLHSCDFLNFGRMIQRRAMDLQKRLLNYQTLQKKI